MSLLNGTSPVPSESDWVLTAQWLELTLIQSGNLNASLQPSPSDSKAILLYKLLLALTS